MSRWTGGPVLALAMTMGACASPATPPEQAGDLGAPDEAAVEDLAAAEDLAPVDLLRSDAPPRDLASRDLSDPDAWNRDLSAPDLSLRDLWNPDLAARDLSLRDLWNPDLAAGDLAAPPDLLAPDLTACPPVVAAPDVDPWTRRLPGLVPARVFTQGSTIYIDGPTGLVRLGASLSWGGSVTFFGLAANPASNTIDANDPGRELQIALYDPTRAHQPCAATATCVSNPQSCANSISFLGWDPVQGGDRCGNGATVLSSGQVGDALRVVVQPLQWNPTWDHPNCDQQCGRVPVAVTYTLDYRFVHTNVVEVAMEIGSQEALDHPPTGQEFPTLYVSHGKGGPDLPLLLDADGATVAINNDGNDGFYYSNFTSPAHWVTWQNGNRDYGVGLAMDQGTRTWQAWRGDGARSPYFHNVRARIAFGLGPKATVRGVAYLGLGSFATMKALMQGITAARPPFGYLDVPAPGQTLGYTPGQPIDFAGWVLDTARVASVRVEIDGQLAGTLPVGQARADVCKVYPGYDGCPNVGFGGSVPSAGLGPCAHLARVVAVDANGNATVLGERVLAPR